MKKVLSLILALTMLLGCSLTAFAAVNAEMCEYCEDGTVVWETDWIMVEETFRYVLCDKDLIDAFEYTEYRTYACRDCGEVAHWQYRDVFDCALDSHKNEYSNYRIVFP